MRRANSSTSFHLQICDDLSLDGHLFLLSTRNISVSDCMVSGRCLRCRVKDSCGSDRARQTLDSKSGRNRPSAWEDSPAKRRNYIFSDRDLGDGPRQCLDGLLHRLTRSSRRRFRQANVLRNRMRCSNPVGSIASTTASSNASLALPGRRVSFLCGVAILPTFFDTSQRKLSTLLSATPTSPCSPTRRSEMAMLSG